MTHPSLYSISFSFLLFINLTASISDSSSLSEYPPNSSYPAWGASNPCVAYASSNPVMAAESGANGQIKPATSPMDSSDCQQAIQRDMGKMLTDLHTIHDVSTIDLVEAAARDSPSRVGIINQLLSDVNTGIQQLQNRQKDLIADGVVFSKAAELPGVVMPAQIDATSFTNNLAKRTTAFQDSLDSFTRTQSDIQLKELSSVFDAYSNGLTALQTSQAAILPILDSGLADAESDTQSLTKTVSSLTTALRTQLSGLGQLQASFVGSGNYTVNQGYSDILKIAATQLDQGYAAAKLKLNGSFAGILKDQDAAEDKLTVDVKADIVGLQSTDEQLSANLTSDVLALRGQGDSALDGIVNNVSDFARNLSATGTGLLLHQNGSAIKLKADVISLAQAVDYYLKITAANRQAAKVASTVLLSGVNDLLTGVTAAFRNKSSQLTGGAGIGLNNQVNSLDAAKQQFTSALGTAASKAKKASSNQTVAVSGHAMQIYATLADLLLELHTLDKYVRAKMGSSSAASQETLRLMNGYMSSGADDLSSTVALLSDKARSDIVDNQAALLGATTDATLKAQQNLRDNAEVLLASQKKADVVYGDAASLAARHANMQLGGIKGVASVVGNAQNALTAQDMASKNLKSATDSGLIEITSSSGQLNRSTAIALSGAANDTDIYLVDQVTNMFNAINRSATELNSTVAFGFSELQSYLADTITSIATITSDLLGEGNATLKVTEGTSKGVESILTYLNTQSEAASAYMTNIVTNASASFNSSVNIVRTNYLTTLNDAAVSLVNQSSNKFNDVYATANRTLSASEAEAANLVLNSTLAAIEARAMQNQVDQIYKDYRLAVSVSNTSSVSQAKSLSSTITNLTESAANLTSRVSATWSYLRSQLAAATTQVSAVNVSLPGMIQAAVQNATRALTLDNAIALDTFITGLVASSDFNRNSQRDWLRSQSNGRLQTIASLLSDINLLAVSLGSQVVLRGASDSQSQKMANNALSLIAKALSVLNRQSGAYSMDAASQLQTLQSLSSGLNTSLAGYIGSAGARLQNQAKIAQQTYAFQARVELAKHAGAVYGLGNQVLGLLSGASSQQLAAEGLSSANEQGALQIADLVKSFGTSAKAELETLLDRVQTGKMTMEEAIKAAGKVNIESMKSLADVGEAFLLIIQTYQGQLNQYFADAEQLLTDYRDGVGVTIAAEKVVHMAAAAPLTNLSLQAGQLGASFGAETRAAVNVTNQTMLAMQVTRDDDKLVVNRFRLRIKALITNASNVVTSIRSNTSKSILVAANSAKVNLTSSIVQLRKTKNLNSSSDLKLIHVMLV